MKKSKKTFRRVVVVVIAAFVVGVVAAVLAAATMGGSSEVMDDIDRHFDSLDSPYYEPENYQADAPDIPVAASDKRRNARVLRRPEPESGEKNGAAKKQGKKKGRKRAKSGAKSSASKGRGKTSDGKETSAFAGVRKVAPGTYVIEEALASDARKQPRKYTRGASAHPVEKDGKIVGFRILGVGQGSALSAIGIRNGDVVLAVNGYELKTMDQVLLAVSALRFAKKYRVDLLRGGGRRSLYYRVQPK
jgi:membrane-associated protease RseP (regulator of RpoE activity)